VNGSFWIGAALERSVPCLAAARPFTARRGLASAFGIGAAWARDPRIAALPARESALADDDGHVAEAERIVEQIERRSGVQVGRLASVDAHQAPARAAAGRRSTLLRKYPRRSLYGFVLMTTQAFFYNAIFFTYALVLGRFFGVPEHRVGLYILPFAAGNFLGPLLLGHLFDVVGRRPMIAMTYAASGLLLAVTAMMFDAGLLTAVGQTAAWCVVFFFASAAASSAYLTVGEIFPLEMRALAIAIFYAIGTGAGGVVGPWLFGALIGTGERRLIAIGYLVGSLLMLLAAALTVWIGVSAERRPLEDVATPLSCDDP
jgi:hypothetical protein